MVDAITGGKATRKVGCYDDMKTLDYIKALEEENKKLKKQLAAQEDHIEYLEGQLEQCEEQHTRRD